MHKCPKCGTEFEGNFCPECGEKFVEEKKCPKCGAVLSGSAKFCNECGYSFYEKPAPTPEPAPIPEPAPTPAPAPAASAPVKPKDRLTVTVRTYKLHSAISVLPAVLLGVVSVLMFLFFLAPVAVMPGGDFMGETIPSESYGNVYEISNYAGMSFNGSIMTLIILAAIALFVAFLVAISYAFSKLRYVRIPVAGRKIPLCDLLTGVGYTVLFAFFLSSCILMGQIANEGGGLGIMAAGAAPILALVFSLVFTLAAAACLFVGIRLCKKYPALVVLQEKKFAAAKSTAVENWIKGHKKFTIIFSILLVIAIVVGITVPVVLANRHNGTYYSYNGETEEYDMTRYYRLTGGSWEDESGMKGEIAFDGEKVTLTCDLSNGMDKTGSSTVTLEGTIVDDVLKIGGSTYAKEGHWHRMNNRECACGKRDNSSEGLEFTKIDGHWTVSKGTCTDADVVISAWHEDGPVTEIAYRAFYGCSTMRSITIPDSVTSIGDYAFYDCSGLTSITIPDSVTSIGDYAFYDCSGLTSITIPDSVVSIGRGPFSGCSMLESIIVGNKNPNYSSHEGILYLHREDHKIIFSVPVKIKGAVTILDGVTSIPSFAFANCIELTGITIPDSVTSIGHRAFEGCKGLTIIDIPNSVTSIEYSAFRDCSGLSSVVIGSGVTSIGEEAFDRCQHLTDIQFRGTVQEWQAIKKGSDWNYGTPNYTVTCTDGTISKDGTVSYF